jgi:hypothetical protein
LLLWRDWSRASAPSTVASVGLSLLAMALGGLSYGLLRLGLPLAVLAGLSTGSALALGLWRWRRLAGFPSAWPTGRQA